jgi:hypothetical protein
VSNIRSKEDAICLNGPLVMVSLKEVYVPFLHEKGERKLEGKEYQKGI